MLMHRSIKIGCIILLLFTISICNASRQESTLNPTHQFTNSPPIDSYFSDLWITSKVKASYIQAKFYYQKNIPIFQIHVETNHGVVYLSGTTDTDQQTKEIINITKQIGGVKNVESCIKVQSSISSLRSSL